MSSVRVADLPLSKRKRVPEAQLTYGRALRFHFGREGVEQDLGRAAALYRNAIEHADVAAMFNLAYLLVNGGEGVTRDVVEGMALYRKASAHGHVGAMVNLGVLLVNGGEGLERDVVEGVSLYQRAGDHGHAIAMNNLGVLLVNGGEGIDRDVVEGMALCRKAVEHGHVGAMFNLGLLCVNGGEGVTRDVVEGMSLYRRAAEHGHVGAMFHLGYLLMNGAEGIERDAVEGMSLYRKAVEHGHIGAMFNLALLLVNGGEGVRRDLVEGISMYRKAIEHGDIDAMNNLGLLLVSGRGGVTQDVVEGVSLYRNAIAHGHIGAMLNLGKLLVSGLDRVESDIPEAMALFREAAAHGNQKAIHRLAWMLVSGGSGVNRNVPEALSLYERTITLGDSSAMEEMGWSILFGTTGGLEDQSARKERCLKIEGHDNSLHSRLIDAGPRWGYNGVEKELEVFTFFREAIPNCLVGILITHIYHTQKTLGANNKCTATTARKFRQDALIIRMRDTSRVLLCFIEVERKLVWKFRGSDPVSLAKEFLRGIEGEGDCLSSFTNISHTHMIMLNCDSSQGGCGAGKAVQIELSLKWLFESKTPWSVPRRIFGSRSSLLPVNDLTCNSCLRSWSREDVNKSLQMTNRNKIGASAVMRPVPRHAQFDVFISHAGPDKLTVAKPIHQSLARHNVSAFLDYQHLQILDRTAPEEMEWAMQNARIGVFILSPEFAGREWTMRELRCFLDRDTICRREGRTRPVLLPIFHRLSLLECSRCESQVYGEGSMHHDRLRKEKFFDEDRQYQCSTQDAIEALKGLKQHAGIEYRRRGGGEDLSAAEVVDIAVDRILSFLRRDGAR